MVVDIDVAESGGDLMYSPFGCVPKADTDSSKEARVIHDLSFPVDASVNDPSDPAELPLLVYEHIGAIARRIEDLKRRSPSTPIQLMRGDVKWAFKHVRGHPSVCTKFAGLVPTQNTAVIDLALPFGWTGSPAHYGVFGSAISFLVRRESPSSMQPGGLDTDLFFCFDWVGDHMLVEEDVGHRLELCECALRLAMLAVLGPRFINHKQFTAWSSQDRALGLDWDTEHQTVSIPEDKIAKALRRICTAQQKLSATRTELSQLLGSLRHVCSCIRPAKKPFFLLYTIELRDPVQFDLIPKLASTSRGLTPFYNMVGFVACPCGFSRSTQRRSSTF